MHTLNVGLVGCGRIARLVHVPVLAALPEARVVALAEPDPARRAEAGKQAPGAALFADYRDLLSAADVEAVVLCLPPALHAEAAIAAFEAGKHVYLEKPLATNLEEAEAVLAAWRVAATVGMIGFNYRFNPFYQRARQHLQAGTLGELIGARSVFSVMTRTLPRWKEARQSGGGVLLDLASHHIDLMHFLFGQDVATVFAGLQSQRYEGDGASLQLQFDSGLLAQCFCSMLSVEDHRVEIYGQQGKLTVDRTELRDVQMTKPTMKHARLQRLRRGLSTLHPRVLLRSPGHEPSYATAFRAFVQAVRGSHPALPDLNDGYRSLVVVVAAETSARTGRAISLEGRTYENYACQ